MSFLRPELSRFYRIAAGLLLVLVPPASAVDTLTLNLERLGGEDWEAHSVELVIDWQTGNEAGLSFSAERISHPALPQPLDRIRLDCPQALVDDKAVVCRQGTAYLPHPDLDQPDIPVSFRWERDSQTLDLTLERLRIAGGGLRLALHAGPEEWRLVLQGKALDLARLKSLVAAHLQQSMDVDLAGQGRLQALLVGDGAGPAHIEWDLNFTETSFSDAGGENLGEGLAGRWQGDLRLVPDRHWKGSQSLELAQGAMLTPFFYLEPKRQALSLSAQIHHDPQTQRLDVTELRFTHPGLLQFDLAATVAVDEPTTIERLRLEVPAFELQPFYTSYIQPTQAESLLANLAWRGRAGLAIDYVANGPQRAVLELSEVAVDEVVKPVEGVEIAQLRSLGLEGVNGQLVWTHGRPAEPSRLSWERGHLLERISLGATALTFQFSGQQAELLQPAAMPLLDGSLQLRRFRFFPGEQGTRLEFDGALEPISMESFSQAMGWPILAGKLAGSISDAVYEQDVLTVGGSIVTNVFDGVVIVNNLRLSGLFGVWPTLDADLKFRGLDLQTLTSTFSFGKITGRLDGQVDALYMENWRPVAFDARFATPDNDDSRRRISQRAVDNISNLGGSGISGAVSRSFLRFFEEFGYARLGISCRLKNGVCEMGGVEAANGGYYLVKGGGIPRIDIVGFNRRIDWDLLVQKLVEISQSGTPVVE